MRSRSHIILIMQEEAATKMEAMFGMDDAPLEVEGLGIGRTAADYVMRSNSALLHRRRAKCPEGGVGRGDSAP